MKKIIIFFILFIISINFVFACIDINTASISELDEIKWVGPTTAQYIIDDRPFNSVDDLIRVSGIGEIKLQDIKDQGLACVNLENSSSEKIITSEDNEKDSEDEKIDEDEETIVIQSKEKDFEKREIQTINLNPKTINTKQDVQKTSQNNYILYGLGIFSFFILILFLLKKKQDKNEFE